MLAPFAEVYSGIESHFGINYLGHMLLTHLLLPMLRAGASADRHARVVNLSSCVHSIMNLGRMEDLSHPSAAAYSCHAAYARSKLAILMFSYTLSRMTTDYNIDVHAVHPGVVDTPLYRHVSCVLQPIRFMFAKVLFYSAAQGAATVLTAACSPSYENRSGLYFAGCRPTLSSIASHNLAVQTQLWHYSCALLSIPSKWET
jgi:NAD(P)-dependent dehydrogenase (short-subunit alcohol dehydrogenase family)